MVRKTTRGVRVHTYFAKLLIITHFFDIPVNAVRLGLRMSRDLKAEKRARVEANISGWRVRSMDSLRTLAIMLESC